MVNMMNNLNVQDKLMTSHNQFYYQNDHPSDQL
jgi:hypothetical protein